MAEMIHDIMPLNLAVTHISDKFIENTLKQELRPSDSVGAAEALQYFLSGPQNIILMPGSHTVIRHLP